MKSFIHQADLNQVGVQPNQVNIGHVHCFVIVSIVFMYSNIFMTVSLDPHQNNMLHKCSIKSFIVYRHPFI